MYDIKYSLPTDGAEASGPRQGRTSRGVSGALYSQSAIARLNSCVRFAFCKGETSVSGVDEWVLCNVGL